jgi:plastocyanin
MSGTRKRQIGLLIGAGLCLAGSGLPGLTPSAWAANHTVMVRNFEFAPKDIVIQKGDTVIWEWETGAHTTTNGTGGADPNSGTLWDAPITSSNTTFQYTFDDAGSFPYYCVPHELANMVGSVTVEEGTPTETITWGRIKRIFDNTRGTVGGMR